ncbi:uncharacterized protein LOC117342858 [Pecten maximus]|uniref:uncharacterized protein LOC117342858 n=1 Tax=Pecten maximus TaxID=6579 RepID=UPI001458D3CC|nr:uncharacterized protein LOC117342858 [Pecten maximus]
MVSNVTIVSGISAVILLVIQAVSIATPNWFVVTLSGKTVLQIGLFAVCVPDKECIPYGKYMFENDGPSMSYICFVGLNLLGCLLNLVFIVTGITQAVSSTPRPERSFIQRQAVLWFFSAAFLLAAVIWIYVSLAANMEKYTLNSSVSVDPGYSLILGCLTGVSYLIAAITLTGLARRLPVPAVPTTGFLVNGAPQVLVMQTDSRGYPPVGNAGYPQNATAGLPTNPEYGLPQDHPSYGYNQ